ncbi:MAG: L-iditol 2-dehydrogenase, partial [Nitrosarchaeum sp.]
VMMFGVPSKDATIVLNMSKMYSKEITLVTSYAASDVDTKEALRLIESSQINVKQLVTHTYSIQDSQKAFDHARSGDNAMKIIITK